MLRPEASTSNSSFFVRLSIDELTGSLNLSAKVGIADRLLGHEVDPAGEELLELVGEIKVPTGVGRIGLPIGHFDEEVEIAGGLEAIRSRRTKEIKAPHAIAPAEIGKRSKVSLD